MAIDLRKLRIASPCTEKWDAMTGDDRTRHCAKCRLNVFNFAGMSTPEIEALLTEKEGRVCARLFRRSDGTVLTKDCPVGLRRARMKLAGALTAVVALALAVIGSFRTQERDAAVFVDDTPASGGPFWTLVRERANGLEDEARKVPVVGALIDKIDPPEPVMIMGEVAGP